MKDKNVLARSVPRIPCAIYTRKSSEEGLEQSFNSLDAQREACAAYILSQKAEGWFAVPTLYDDGGFSGGNMERPGLRALMADIAARRVKIVVVYKVDRLTRSLGDFARMVDLFDAHEVSFVSVTQQFNTTTSMGRLTLNVLLSFAQFEREVTGERIRDKIAASKAKGMWMGGVPPIGYIAQDRTLVIHEPTAQLIRDIFDLYLETGTINLLKMEIERRGWRTPLRTSRQLTETGGAPFSRGHLGRLLTSPVYIGQVVHKGRVYPGQHERIIDQGVWEAVQAKLDDNRQGHKQRGQAIVPSLLAGLVWDEWGERLTPSHSQKGNRRYRYYVGERGSQDRKEASNSSVGPGKKSTTALRIPAHELENAVLHGLGDFLRKDTEVFRLTDERGMVEADRVHAILVQAHDLAQRLERNMTATSTDTRRDTDTQSHKDGGVGSASDTSSVIPLLQRLVERVVVKADQVEIEVRVDSVLTLEGDGERQQWVPLDAGIEQTGRVDETADLGQSEVKTDPDLHTIILPTKLKRSGLAMRLIVTGSTHLRDADPRLVQLLTKAHGWFDRLVSGKVESIHALANAEKVTGAYVTRVIYVAFLAPDIVKAILQGTQPHHLTANVLMRAVPLPIDWVAQRKVLGVG